MLKLEPQLTANGSKTQSVPSEVNIYIGIVAISDERASVGVET